jgi:excisionase family DNA binding protein
MAIERRWLKPAEAADRLGISRKRIYNLISLKKIPFSRPPGLGVRIDWKAVEAMYEKAQIQPTN